MCKAAVPFTVTTAYLAPVKSAKSFSKRSTNFPTDETQPVSKHSLTYSHSRPEKLGSCKAVTPPLVGKLKCIASKILLNIVYRRLIIFFIFTLQEPLNGFL